MSQPTRTPEEWMRAAASMRAAAAGIDWSKLDFSKLDMKDIGVSLGPPMTREQMMQYRAGRGVHIIKADNVKAPVKASKTPPTKTVNNTDKTTKTTKTPPTKTPPTETPPTKTPPTKTPPTETPQTETPPTETPPTETPPTHETPRADETSDREGVKPTPATERP